MDWKFIHRFDTVSVNALRLWLAVALWFVWNGFPDALYDITTRQLGLTALTTSGSSQIVQRSAADFSAADDGALTFRCDGAVWVMIAAAPTAAAGANFYLAANERLEFSVEAGDKIAVINA
ncbi:MAG: hypothetical protein IIC56_12105 [Proteobacteria bacterium]|nr:hypothetical protein [Pseudomonadota bacterium]